MDKLTLVRSRGSYRWDSFGVRYLDFTSGGIFAAIFGSNSLYMRNAISRSSSLCCYEAHYESPEALRLKDMLKEMTGYESVCLFSTGAEATEALWRTCRVATGKPGVWGGLVNPDEVGNTDPAPQPDAMHGMTLGALIMAGKMALPNRGMFRELGADFEGKGQEHTSCAIFEPYHAASAQFHRESPTMDRLRERIKEFPDLHFCCDEIQGGLGRTGKLFALEWYQPSMRTEFVTLGKALGGGLPLSALLGPRDILEDPHVVEHAHLHSTHSGNPLMCVAGIAVLERLQKDNMINEVYRKGLLLSDNLKDCGVRVHAGKGLLAGLEMEGPLMTTKVVEACRRRGLLVVDTGRKWVKLGPAFNISDEQIVAGCKILKEAIEEVKDANATSCGDSGSEPGQEQGLLREAGLPDGELGQGEVAAGTPGNEATDPG